MKNLVGILTMLSSTSVLLLAQVSQTQAVPNVTLNLAQTGQSTCYANNGAPTACAGTGQDGDLRAGVAWPAPRFQDSGDETLTDSLTGLIWSRNAESPGNNLYNCSATTITMNWQQALDHVTCLNARRFGGFDDWRLPNIGELESLVNSEVASSDDWLESQGFLNVWGSYWSSTTVATAEAPAGTYAYHLNFSNNETGITNKTATTYLPAVWPVRGTTGGVTPLWRTGQTQSYALYDDGHYQMGLAGPAARFTQQDDCVTDRMTGLMWPQNADRLNGLRAWQEALSYAQGLNLCGHDDWRLPNRRELWSLVNFGATSPGAWLAGQGFANVRYQPTGPGQLYYGYWTSTTYVWNPVAAYGVRLDSGDIFAFMKQGPAAQGWVWPVRSGSIGPNPLPTDTPTPTPTQPPTPTPSPTPTQPPKPILEQVLPTAGQAALAGSLQIGGANFQPGAVARLGSNIVLSTTYVSSSELLAHLPALAPGGYDLTVSNPDGNAGTMFAAYQAQGPAGDDLYGFSYELKSARQVEGVGEGTWLLFVVHRLGGAAPLTNVRVAFYLGNPAQGGQNLGEVLIASLAPNRSADVRVPWTPAQAGDFELYAVIDPLDEIAETNPDNNAYANWVVARAAAPVDTTPPTVDSVATSLSYYTPQIQVSVQATDPAPSSGLGWLYFLTWEFIPSINDWLVMEESGWHAYQSSNSLSIFDWPGPRFLEVYAADTAQNVSDPSGWGVFNYIPPDDFLLTGESRWYLYPLLAGDRLQAQLQVRWPDADLYLWGADGTRYAYSATDGAATEAVDFVAPVAGYYWVEIYAYADYPSFFLSAAVTPVAREDGSAIAPLTALSQVSAGSAALAATALAKLANAHAPRTTAGLDLAAAPITPSRSFRLPPIAGKLFLPVITTGGR